MLFELMFERINRYYEFVKRMLIKHSPDYLIRKEELNKINTEKEWEFEKNNKRELREDLSIVKTNERDCHFHRKFK